MVCVSALHLGHVQRAHRQRLVAQDGPVLVPLASLQHDLQLVALSLQVVRILESHNKKKRS